MTELWVRNPSNYIREYVEVVGPSIQPKIVWDRGNLVKKKIDPVRHAKIYFGDNSDFRILAVGLQGTAEMNKNHTFDNPVAVYPTWGYGEEFRILEEMVAYPIGEDVEACSSSVQKDERPVLGQEHRVVITDLPNAGLSSSRPFYRHLAELQEEHPECIIMLHGSYSYRIMFSYGYASCDFEPRSHAANGKVILPNGKTLAYAHAVSYQQWIHLVGMSVPELKEPRQRCMFNIRSAIWASEHYNEDIKFKTRGEVEVDPDSPTYELPKTNNVRTQLAIVQVGDKVNCDSCSLADAGCKFYREGAVCTLPRSETNQLAKAFQSRNSDRIIDGLGTVLAAQAKRLERGMEVEEDTEVLDPEVGKLMNQLFQNGVKMAKLIDPNLSKPLIQINGVNRGGNGSQKEIVRSVMQALEGQGFARDQITEDLFTQTMQSMYPQVMTPIKTIEGQVVSK